MHRLETFLASFETNFKHELTKIKGIKLKRA